MAREKYNSRESYFFKIQGKKEGRKMIIYLGELTLRSEIFLLYFQENYPFASPLSISSLLCLITVREKKKKKIDGYSVIMLHNF